MMVRAVSLAILAAFGFVSPARALVFDFSQISGDTLTASEINAFDAAGAAWSAVLSNPVAVDVSVGFAALGSNVLAQTTPSLVTESYPAVQAALFAHGESAATVLPAAVQNNTVMLTTAQAKALGAAPAAASDGSIEFNSSFNFVTSRSSNGTVPAGAYDMIGIAEHELGHVLGFFSSLDFSLRDKSILDLFRYSAPDAPSFTSGQAAYFSLDGGVTNLADFSTGSGDQASHWANGLLDGGVPAVMDPEGASGVPLNITPVDALALTSIGYTAVPEPSAGMLLATAVLAAFGLVRRRR